MFKNDPDDHKYVQLPASLRNTPLFDAEGNVWRIDEERKKKFDLFPRTTLTLTRHSGTKPFIDSQVRDSIQKTMRLWIEKYALPELTRMAPLMNAYLEECAQEAKRLCTRKFLNALSTEGAQCLAEIMKNVLSDMERLVTKKISLSEELEQQSPDILPYGTRFHWNLKSENITYQIFCIETPPQQRTISIMDELKRLAFPWMYFITIFRDKSFLRLYVFYRNATLTSLDDMLCLPNLPNMHTRTLKCCLGGGCPHLLIRDKKWPETLFTYFWGSSFYERSPTYLEFYEDAAKKIPELKDLDTWETMSTENPFFVLRLPWKEIFTLRTFINKRLLEFGITTQIATTQQENHDAQNAIEKRYATDFGKDLAIRLHTLCDTLSPEIDTTRITRERLTVFLGETERHLATTLSEVDTSVSEILSNSIAHIMETYKEEKYS